LDFSGSASNRSLFSSIVTAERVDDVDRSSILGFAGEAALIDFLIDFLIDALDKRWFQEFLFWFSFSPDPIIGASIS
jgi:hypothetical protein